MKKVITLIALFFVSCVNNQTQDVEVIQMPIELDRPRMEFLIQNMPLILKKSMDFANINQAKLSDQEYNTRLYKYLFEDSDLNQQFIDSGFLTVEEYAEFYNTMIEIYLLIKEQPDTVKTAVVTIPAQEREVSALLLKQVNEPNNVKLMQTLNQIQYELQSYKNIVMVNAFLGELNSFNKVYE